MSQPLRHFWFEFEIPVVADCPRGVRAGVGVTAVDREDAMTILEERVFSGLVLDLRLAQTRAALDWLRRLDAYL